MALMVIELRDGSRYEMPYTFGENDEEDCDALLALKLFKDEVIDCYITEDGDGKTRPTFPVCLEMRYIEKQLVLEALRRSGWIQSKAAKILGITGRVISYKIDQLGIERPPDQKLMWRK